MCIILYGVNDFVVRAVSCLRNSDPRTKVNNDAATVLHVCGILYGVVRFEIVDFWIGVSLV